MEYTLVTGASGGLGSEFCRQLAEKKQNLIITARSKEKLNCLAKQLSKFEIDVLSVECELTSEQSRQRAFAYLTEKNVTIKRLINVAGVDTQKAFEKFSHENIVKQTRVNFEAAAAFTKFALDNRCGELEILTVSSMCGLTSFPYFSLYSATKAALLKFFEGLRYELKDKNVKITTVLPGSVPTREDIIKDIEIQGLQGKLSAMDKKTVVEKSLKALKKNKRRYIPGVYNKIVAFFCNIAPYSLKMKILSKKFKNKEKDAF